MHDVCLLKNLTIIITHMLFGVYICQKVLQAFCNNMLVRIGGHTARGSGMRISNEWRWVKALSRHHLFLYFLYILNSLANFKESFCRLVACKWAPDIKHFQVCRMWSYIHIWSGIHSQATCMHAIDLQACTSATTDYRILQRFESSYLSNDFVIAIYS